MKIANVNCHYHDGVPTVQRLKTKQMKTFEKAGYSRNWGLIRFLCALAVIFSHAYALTEDSSLREPLGRLTDYNLNFGSLAVSFFSAWAAS